MYAEVAAEVRRDWIAAREEERYASSPSQRRTCPSITSRRSSGSA
jgi:hypothetical protein